MESDYPAQHRYQTRSKSNKSKRKIYLKDEMKNKFQTPNHQIQM